MANLLPKFDAPPVVETVIGVQFSRLEKFSGPYAGLFWREHLTAEWNDVLETGRLEDQFELFDGDTLWPSGIPVFRLQPTAETRVQIMHKSRERMIQLQDSRFILNWQKQSNAYPSFDVLHAEFERYFPKFLAFAAQSDLGTIQPNQWEVTYVNHVPKGELWNTVADWHMILPHFYPPELGIPARMESRSGDWRFVLGESAGRLYTSVRHAKTKEGAEVLSITLTARGPINDQLSLNDGLSLGHESIVNSFDAITSPRAHEIWKKRRKP